jgi:acetyl-CoA C-acetyltransferase
MSLDPRTPVLVGAAAVQQRVDDPADGVEAVELMVAAARAAADDAGTRAALASVGRVCVPEGTWAYADAGRLVADRIGVPSATTVVADVGVTQQELIADALVSIAGGGCEVALVVGGEARYRALRARLAGVDVPETTQPEGMAPDHTMAPGSLGIADLELVRNAVTPSTAYALIESARRHHLGLDAAEHRTRLGRLYAGMAAVAAANPLAWDRRRYGASELTSASADNRMIASPYTKLLCSQWNVDQAAALLICSVEAAERLGIATDRWVFPHSSAVANHAVPVLQRPEIWRSPNSEIAATAALGDAGVQDAGDLGHLDLYSCFPAAVQTYADAIGLDLAAEPARPVTVTGGMSLAGGPLNNYVLMAMAALVPRLRADAGTFGLSSSVSGFLTKAGFGVWSTTPPEEPVAHRDVTAASGATGPPQRDVDGEHTGGATIVAWTVDHERGEPHRAVVFADTPSGGRTMASTGDQPTCVAMLDGDWIGVDVDVRADGSFTI